MRNFKNRFTKLITLLLVCSMVSGSIPVQAYSVSGNEMETVLMSEEPVALEEGAENPGLESQVEAVEEVITEEYPENQGEASKEIEDQDNLEGSEVKAEEPMEETEENLEESLEEIEEDTEEKAEESLEEAKEELEEKAEESSEESEGEAGETVEETEEESEENPEESEEEILEEEILEEEAVSVLEENKIELTFQAGDGSSTSQWRIYRLNQYGREEEVSSQKVVINEGETFRFRIEPAEGHRVLTVKMGNNAPKPQDGYYSLDPAGSDTIFITTKELEKYDITFWFDDSQVKNLKVNMGKKDVELQDKVAVDMLEESNITFVVNLEDKMKVVKVTVDGKELKPTTGTTYILEKISKDMEVNIETSLDPAKCNVLEIVVYGHRNSISVYHEGSIYQNGDQILTTDITEEIVVGLDPNYKVTQLKLNNSTDSYTGTSRTYSINFTSKRVQKLEIYTAPLTTDKAKKIVFANKSENITYEINPNAPKDKNKVIVTKEEGKQNSYRIEPNEPTVEFTVKVKDGYELKLDFSNTNPDAKEVLYDVTKKENTYTYSVAVATLGGADDPTEIILEESPQMRTIDIFYEESEIESILATIDGKIIAGTEQTDPDTKEKYRSFEYSYNKDLVLRIKAAEAFQVEEIKEIPLEGSTKTVAVQKNESTYTVSMNKDKKVEIITGGAYYVKIAPKESKDSYLEKENNLYPVEGGKEYIANLYYGNYSQPIEAVLKNGSKIVDGKISIKDIDNAHFTIPASEIGKTLTLELSTQNQGMASTTFVKLNVLQQGKITSIEGIKNEKVSQEIDTRKEYKISKNNKNIDIGTEIVTAVDDIYIWDDSRREELNEIANESFQAVIEEDVMKITVGTCEAGEKAYIKLYDKTKSTNSDKYYLPGGNILITATEPAIMSKNPTVKLKNSTNLDLILDLTMKGVGELEKGSLWYQISVTPKYTTKTEQEILDNTKAFVEYRPYRKEAQTEQIRVVARENSNIEEGMIPYKADFEVKVKLVTTKDKNLPAESGENKNVLLISSKEVKQSMSTKAPIYETNLGIKMVTNTIYSGQEELVMASPVFSKNTSYQKISCVAPQGIEAKPDADNNIVVSVESDVKPGTYAIRVTAEAAKDTVKSVKEFTIQVVQGIYKIDLISSVEVYKQYNKEASLSVETVFNDGNKEKEPKKKDVEWSLEDADGNEIDKDHEQYKYFSIKNGVVTVAKDFIISGTQKENQFRVVIKAKDFERKQELVAKSKLITVTNKTVTLGELVLVKEKVDQPGKYEVMARSTNTVPLDKVHGSKAVILRKGTPEREEYGETDFITDLQNIQFYTSDSKILLLEAGYQMNAKTTGKKLSITAKTTDGSNKEVSLKDLTLELGKSTDLGMTITNLRNYAIIGDSYAGEEIDFYGLKDETFRISIKEKRSDGSDYFYGGNHQLKVEGAKIVESNTIEGWYTIVGTSEVITLRLLNNTSKIEKVFLLRNKTYYNDEVKTSKAITLKVEGDPLTGYSKEEQTIWFVLPKESIGKYTHAWITLDTLERLDTKKASYYQEVEKAAKGSLGVIKRVESDGRIGITFTPQEGEDTYYLPDADYTYKFNVALGKVTDNYDFESQVKTNVVSVKLKKQKTLNTAIVNSYAISAKENGLAELQLKDKNLKLTEAVSLINKNISGKRNNFTSYFELVTIKDSLGQDHFYLRLKSGVNPKEIKSNDTSGYITSYTVSDGRRNIVIENAAVSVSLKDLILKHTLTEASVFTNENISTGVIFSSGGQKNPVKYVYVEEKENFTESVKQDGTILLTSKENDKIKATNKFTIYILPEDSHFISMMAEENSENWKNQMKEFGIKLSAVVKVKNKSNTTGKIKFEGNALKVNFTKDHFIPENSGTSGVYKIKVPYTKTVDWEVQNITADFREGLVRIEKVTGEDAVEVILSKEALKNEFKKDAKFYGKNFTVKATAEFGEGTKAETFNFTVKMPTQPMDIEKVAKNIQEAAWSKISINYQGLSGQGLIDANIESVKEEVKQHLSPDGDVTYLVTGEVENPTDMKEGRVVFKILLTEEGKQMMPRITFTIPKLYASPSELAAAVEAKIQEWNTKKITNDTKISEILASIRSGIKISEQPHLRLYAKEVEYRKATIQSTGSIKGVFSLTSLVEMDVPEVTIEFTFTIPRLMTPEEAVTAIRNEVEKITITNKDLGQQKQQKVEQILKTAYDVVEGNPYGVIVKQGTTLNGTPADSVTSGEATITLQIYYLTTQQNHIDIKCNFTVVQQ